KIRRVVYIGSLIPGLEVSNMSFFGVVKKIILWSYERGSWQYDILCVLILTFIFLTPGRLFDERLRVDDAQQRTYVRSADLATSNVYTNLHDLLTDTVSQKYQRKVAVKRFEIDSDLDGNIRGYRVWFDRE